MGSTGTPLAPWISHLNTVFSIICRRGVFLFIFFNSLLRTWFSLFSSCSFFGGFRIFSLFPLSTCPFLISVRFSFRCYLRFSFRFFYWPFFLVPTIFVLRVNCRTCFFRSNHKRAPSSDHSMSWLSIYHRHSTAQSTLHKALTCTSKYARYVFYRKRADQSPTTIDRAPKIMGVCPLRNVFCFGGHLVSIAVPPSRALYIRSPDHMCTPEQQCDWIAWLPTSCIPGFYLYTSIVVNICWPKPSSKPPAAAAV